MSVIYCCRDAMALLTEDREGALSGVERATFVVHLSFCGRCKSYRAQLDATVAVLHAIPRGSPKAADVDAILQRLAEAE
jgi:Putative zinc-finger